MSSAARPHILLAGCGRWGVNILRDLLAAGCDVTVADPSPEARRGAEAMGARAIGDPGAVDRADGAIVATPAGRHAETIDAIAPMGVPIFCEKPLTADSGSARRLARELSGRLFVMEKWRYHAAVEAMRDLAREGTLGAALALRARRVQPDIAASDVDPVWTLAPHDLSIVREIFGGLPEPRSARIEREGSAVVALRAALGERPRAEIEVSARAAERRREIALEFERGRAAWSDFRPDWLELEGGGLTGRPLPARPTSLEREIEAFVAFLHGGPEPRSSAREAAEAVEVLERLIASAGKRP